MQFGSLALSALLMAASAQATTTYYTSSASFYAAAAPILLPPEGYETQPLNMLVPNGSLINGFGYQFNSAAIGRIGNVYNKFDAQSLEAERDGDLTSDDYFFDGDSISIAAPYHLHVFGVFLNANALSTDSIFLSGFDGGTFFSGSGGWDTSTFYFVGAITDAHDVFGVTFGMLPGGSSFNVDNLSVPFEPIPEPANWALMVAGFGLAGSALRYNRRAIVHG